MHVDRSQLNVNDTSGRPSAGTGAEQASELLDAIDQLQRRVNALMAILRLIPFLLPAEEALEFGGELVA